jgi:hypothetical protein
MIDHDHIYTFDDLLKVILPDKPDVQQWILDKDPQDVSVLVDAASYIIKHCRQLGISEVELLLGICEPLRALRPYIPTAEVRDGGTVFRRLGEWDLLYETIARACTLTAAAVEGDEVSLSVIEAKMESRKRGEI